jgi:hypothetical protein
MNINYMDSSTTSTLVSSSASRVEEAVSTMIGGLSKSICSDNFNRMLVALFVLLLLYLAYAVGNGIIASPFGKKK